MQLNHRGHRGIPPIKGYFFSPSVPAMVSFLLRFFILTIYLFEFQVTLCYNVQQWRISLKNRYLRRCCLLPENLLPSAAFQRQQIYRNRKSKNCWMNWRPTTSRGIPVSLSLG